MVVPTGTLDAAAVKSSPMNAAPMNAAPMDEPDDEEPFDGPCGGTVCPDNHFCETRFKGHRLSSDGRPLERTKCMALPTQCRANPTCACVKKSISFTRCTEADGLVSTSDYPY